LPPVLYSAILFMIKWLIILTAIISSQLFYELKAQDNAISPQLWNNVYVGWNITDKIVLRNALSYNVLVGSEVPWSELTYSVSGVYRFHRFMEVNAGLYLARTKQITNLKSSEFRPFAGFRIFSNDEKRWLITNLSRFEMRSMIYSDQKIAFGFRFRNRTYAAVSLIKPTMVSDKNLFLFAYFEAFFNFGQEIRERFFNQFKYKLGFVYRLSYTWRFDAGLIYQDANDNMGIPVNPIRNEITYFVFEWGVAYFIPEKKRN